MKHGQHILVLMLNNIDSFQLIIPVSMIVNPSAAVKEVRESIIEAEINTSLLYIIINAR